MKSEHVYKGYKEWLTVIIDKYKVRIVVSALIVFFRGVILLMPAVITQQIIDNILPSGSFHKLTMYAVILVVIPFTVTVLIIVDLFIDKYILKEMSEVRYNIYNGIQYRSLQWFREIPIGDLVNRMLDETEDITNFAYFGIGSIIWFNVTIIAGLSIMFSRNWKITLLLIAIILCQAYVTNRLGEKHKRNAKALMENGAEFTNKIIEGISGIQFIKAVAGEEEEIQKVSTVLDRQYELLTKQRKIELCRNIVKIAFIAMANLVIYLFGGMLVIDNQLTIGALIAINSLYVWIQPAIFGYQNMYISAKRMFPCLDRVNEIIFPIKSNGGNICPKENTDLKVENVSFAYDSSKTVIQNISFEVKHGQSISVIGPSGSGKSTLSYIVLGLLQPFKGCVKISGIDIDAINKRWFRQNVICVSQASQLRSISILDNILYYKKEISQVEINEILKVACLEEWISQLPQGVHTFIGEQAMMISGGERQRICIARAILRRPQILILDEATAALDRATEAQLIINLKKFLPNSILIFITHRATILSFTDKVIQIDEGKMVKGSTINIKK
jgi:ABC-type bacteriocin/lantibiotic exporter with double-glycine peptidase domain